MNRKATIARMRAIVSLIRHTCEAAGLERDFDALEACIARGERGHRAMGARFTSGQASYRGPASDAVLYFVLKTFAAAPGPQAPIVTIAGLREDFVRAALIVASGNVAAELAPVLTEHRAFIDGLDYCSLIARKVAA